MTSPHCSFATKIKMEAQSGSELKTSSSDSHRLFLLANPSFHLPLHSAMLVELTNTRAIADAVPGVGWHFHIEAFVVLRVAYGLRRFEFSRIFKIEETFCAVRHESVSDCSQTPDDTARRRRLHIRDENVLITLLVRQGVVGGTCAAAPEHLFCWLVFLLFK